MEQWAEFYERLFNFREIRYFDIEGKLTGLRSHAMTSPAARSASRSTNAPTTSRRSRNISRPITAKASSTSRWRRPTSIATVETLRARGVAFMSVPDTYYEAVDARLPGHGEDLARLQRDRILIDGAPGEGQGLLLQIFTETVIGPIFFEIIQRKGNDGFGEGNFRALFELIERDQIRRGVLSPGGAAG